jgi:O-antigen ligase
MTGAKWTIQDTVPTGASGVSGTASSVALGSETRTSGSSYAARAWLAFPILALLFAFMGPYSLHPAAATGEDATVGASAAAAASGVQEGARTRQAAVILLAGFAALTLSAARRRRHLAALAWAGQSNIPSNVIAPPWMGQISTPVLRLLRSVPGALPPRRGSRALLVLLIAYTVLAAASVMWADDVVLAAKRAVVFLVFVFTAFALAQAWSLRELIYFAIFASTMSLALGIGGALVRGDLQPLASEYRFAGFANPNLHGIEAACLIIAAAAALRLGRERRVLLSGLLLFGIGMLLLTKSRTALVALLLAGAVAGLLVVKRHRLIVMMVGAIALVFAVAVFLPDTVTHAHNAALLGRSAQSDNPSTLSGRTLLWEDLLHFASARPWLGYGFDSFWTPVHIAEVSLRRGWVITQSHSGYIEALLNVGRIGASLLVMLLFGGFLAALTRYRRTHTALALFAVAMLIWYMTNLLAEAIPEAHFSTLIVMVLLAHLALRTAAPDDSRAGQLAIS